MVANMCDLVGAEKRSMPRDVTFLAPVQQAASALTVEVSNVADEASAFGFINYGWPVLLALAVWVLAWRSERSLFKSLARVCGWLFVAWAALRFPNGAVAFIWVMAACVLLQLIIPAARRLLRVPKGQPNSVPPKHGAAPAAATILIGLLCLRGLSAHGAPVGHQPPAKTDLPRAELVTHEIRVDDKFVLGTAKIRWPAVKGQALPLLEGSAVLTHLNIPKSLRLTQSKSGGVQELVADASGTFDIEVQYQLQVAKGITEFTLPIRSGLVNRTELTVLNVDVDVLRPSQAVSLERSSAGSNTVAKLVLSPADDIKIAWKPRSRDVKREKPVFYAEVWQLYAPSAGVIEGAHFVSIRPAQGELGELILDVPRGMTITDVVGAVGRREDATKGNDQKNLSLLTSAPTVTLWRFDPEARKLRVTLNPAQSRP